ncbi:RNA-directed DNA polymerase [Psychrobacillus sp. FSL K6-4046]|uniref:RNA-directed DNA polymerase n=1 Tax=Psychrobacillus sp. FSL K6-4046 TaxID=2921550 RepID=UPI00315AD216
MRYDQLIVSYSKNSKYSVRSPIIRNQPVFIPSQAIKDELIRIEQEFSFTQGVSITSDETEAFFYNYFSYRNHKKITNLYKSNKFRRDLYKYNFFKKLDIQNFFGSIYTHSIAWAVFGDKSIAKKYKGRSFDEIFPNATDKVCQLINFNETNGIVVGPEFSRVISELLLTRIDVNLYQALEKENIQLGKDYKIYRFLDDFFIFFNDKKIIEMIEENLFINLESYNLKLNTSKSELQSKPFFVSDPAIIKLISLLDLFLINTQTNLSFSIYNKKTKSLWLKLQQNIELILLEYPNSTSKLLNYFLKFVRSILKLEIHQFNLAHILETITNIYSLNINYHSTHNLIATYAVLSQKIVKLSAEEKYDLKDKVEYLEERFFQHLFISLRDNSDKLPQMYDLFIYLKTLPKKISSDYLCEVLDNYNDYFITCSTPSVRIEVVRG